MNNKPVFTAGRLIRLLSIVCFIIVFCPTFMVSCSGQERGISVMTAVGGIESYGETVVEPHPIMLVCVLLPIAVFVLFTIRKPEEKKRSTAAAGCALADLFVWMYFRLAAKRIAAQNYCDFRSTGWYVLNMISLIGIAVLSVLIFMNRLTEDSDIAEAVSGSLTRHEKKS